MGFMYLEKLEIQGFKSFAEKTLLTFDRGNTAVVGPNGSGKSNVADAVRWVLGEQSLKMLRGKKSEDVIFAGSDTKPQMSMAHVSLFLNNESGKMPLDFPEVVITRKIYRSGESEYLINNSTVRLIDIVELLAKSGFGQKTYSVIGQGMIDVFINSSPTERKLLFEEAAGVKQYQLKRNQTIRKLETTKQNLGRVNDLLQELTPRLRSLERQAKRAEERVTLQEELKTLQVTWFSFFHHDLKAKLKEVNAKHIEAEAGFREIEKDYRELEAKLQESSQDAGSDRQKYEALQEQLAEEQKEKNALEAELARLSGLIEVEKERDYSQDQKALSGQKSILEKEMVGLRDNIQNLEAEAAAAAKNLEAKRLEQAETNEKIEALRAKMRRFEAAQKEKAEAATSDSPELKDQIKDITRAQKTLITEIENCSDISALAEIQSLAAEIHERLSGLSKTLDNEGHTSTAELMTLQGELNGLVEDKESKAGELNEAHIKEQTTASNLKNLQGRLANLEEEVKGLEQKLAMANQKSSGADEENITYLAEKKTGIETKLEKISQKVIETRSALQALDAEDLERKKAFIENEKRVRERRETMNQASQAKNALEVEKARLEVKKEDLDREIQEDIGFDALRTLTEEELKTMGTMNQQQHDDEHRKIEALQVKLTRIGGIDEDVVEEHKEVQERYEFLTKQSEDLEKARADLLEVIKKLDVTIKKQFSQSFKKINTEFDRFFKVLFNGGSAKLSLVRPEKKKPKFGKEDEAGAANAEEENTGKESDLDQEDPTLKSSVEGVEIKANPPGKKLKNLSMLSGGEKAMTSIALLSAIIANNPSPFVVLDEVDAALDDANARRFARIIDTLDDGTQFIVITHNHETMRMAKILYGITMQRDGVSKMLSIKIDDVQEGGEVKTEEES